MKYPTSVSIRGHDYRIEYVDQLREVDSDFECTHYIGTVGSGAIRCYAHQTKLNILDTLIHEMLHALFTRNKMLVTAVKSNMEENFISTLASDMALLLHDNGWVQLPKQPPPITVRINPEVLE